MVMSRFWMPPPICIRQLLSQAATASAPVSAAKESLSFNIAPEISGILDGERAAEPAAYLGLLHLNQLYSRERVNQGAGLGEDA